MNKIPNSKLAATITLPKNKFPSGRSAFLGACAWAGLATVVCSGPAAAEPAPVAAEGFPYGYPFKKYPLGGASSPSASNDYMRQPPRAGDRKRFGQYALRLIQTDRAAAALKFTGDYLPRFADMKQELLFMQALAQVQLGEFDAAAKVIHQAVDEAELPPGRFLAGPGRLFEPMHEHAAFAALRDRMAGDLVHGPMLGAMTDESVRVWVRSAGETPVRVVVSEHSDLTNPLLVSEPVVTRAAEDHTAVVHVSGLAADTRYYYGVLVGAAGEPVRGEHQKFRTFPKRQNPAKFEVVFGGCAGYVPANERMWDTIAAQNPLAVLMLGDNVYVDDPESAEQQRYCYSQRQSRPEFRRLVGSAPMFAIWDDHDFAMDDSSGGPGVELPYWKPMVTKIFQENWVNPSYGGGAERPGVWFDFHLADVHFIMLDGRSYREDSGRLGGGERQKGKTMLGPDQLAWLEKTLAASTATFKMIVSPVPWHDGAKPGRGGLDTWLGYAEEREKIFSWIDQYELQGVLLLSSDRHRSDAYKHERAGGYDLYEFGSGQLTNLHTHDIMEASLFGYNKKPSFGRLSFDTLADDPSLTYRIVNIDGKVIHELQIQRSALK